MSKRTSRTFLLGHNRHLRDENYQVKQLNRRLWDKIKGIQTEIDLIQLYEGNTFYKVYLWVMRKLKRIT